MILLDTHVVYWLACLPEKLSDRAAHAIREAATLPEGIAISTASIYELSWLLDRGRLRPSPSAQVFLNELIRRFVVLPIDAVTAMAAARIPAPFHGDPMDRIIVTAAKNTGRTLISADRLILDAAIGPVVW